MLHYKGKVGDNMINTKTLKLNSIISLKLKKKESKVETDKSLSINDIKSLCRERAKLQIELSKLNITEEMRRKNVLELTEEEKDMLYDEYVLTSAIEGTTDFIEGRYYTCNNMQEVKEFLNQIKEECMIEV